jgi:hypothetical protein
MLTTPRAVLLGLGLVARAIVLQPMARNAFITLALHGFGNQPFGDGDLLIGHHGAFQKVLNRVGANSLYLTVC